MSSERLAIGEVAERTGVATSTLRFYEDEGLISSERTSGNQRRFHRDVIRLVSFIRVAQRVGLGLGEIRQALSTLPSSRPPTRADWSKLSRSWRPRIDERIDALVDLRDKLDSCIGCGCLSLDTCALYNSQDAAARFGSGPRFLLGDRPEDLLDGD